MTGAASAERAMTSATTDLLGNVTDVHKTLTYASGKMGGYFLRLGLLALAAGAALSHLQYLEPSFGLLEWTMLGTTFAVGAACTLYGLVRWLRPVPLLTLSPAGLRLQIDMVKSVLIPWHAVKGVDTIDIGGRVAGRTVFLPGVTVVLVTHAFYRRHIHVNSWVLRGPGWDTNFIPKGDMVQVALQHTALPATAIELREAVEARWRAFRDDKPDDPAPSRPRIFGGFRRT
jgi:hypothetical protein